MVKWTAVIGRKVQAALDLNGRQFSVEFELDNMDPADVIPMDGLGPVDGEVATLGVLEVLELPNIKAIEVG